MFPANLVAAGILETNDAQKGNAVMLHTKPEAQRQALAVLM